MGHSGSKQVDAETPGLGRKPEEFANQKPLRKLFVKRLFQELWQFHKHVLGEILSVTIEHKRSSHAVSHRPPADWYGQIINCFGRHGFESASNEECVSEEHTLCLLENVVLQITFMINLISSTVATESSDDSVQRLLEIKSALRTYNGHLERMSLLQRGICIGSYVPTIEVIRDASNNVKRVLHMFPNTTSRLYGASFSVSHEHFLCSMLGLDMQYAEMLVSMDEVSRTHQRDQYWIEAMMDEANALLLTQDEATQDNPIKSLLFLGLTENRSQVINELLENNIFRDHQSNLYWVKRYINDAFAWHTLLADSGVNPDSANHFSPNGGSTNDTLHFPSPRDMLAETVYVISQEQMRDVLSDREEPSDHYVNLYHGTDRKSAEHMLWNGIQLGKSSAQQEFSDGYGFYVTTDPELAAEWAFHSHFFGKPAVVKYKVPRNILERFVRLDLDSCDNHMKEDIVTYNRTGRDRQVFKLRKEFIVEYKKADFVYGTMSVDSKLTSENYYDNSGVVCILSDSMGTEIGTLNNVDAVFVME